MREFGINIQVNQLTNFGSRAALDTETEYIFTTTLKLDKDKLLNIALSMGDNGYILPKFVVAKAEWHQTWLKSIEDIGLNRWRIIITEPGLD